MTTTQLPVFRKMYDLNLMLIRLVNNFPKQYKYNVGDELTIYYNTKNPEEWRRDISYASEESFIIIAVIILGLRIFGLTKSIINKKLINNV